MLCNFSNQFPPFVEQFLNQGRKLRRRFREETVTDLLMGGLVMAGGYRLIVEFPNEPVTGADMEWNFVDESTSSFFRLMLQAKKVYGDGYRWTRHYYKELLHTSGKGGKFQAVSLCDNARHAKSATYPLYIFYHSSHTCELARGSGNSTIAGVNIVDGFAIERLVKTATTRRLRTINKSLGVISPMFAPLSDLFCPPTIVPVPPFAFAANAASTPLYFSSAQGHRVLGFPIPPTPSDIRDRLFRLREVTSALDDKAIGEISETRPEIPQPSETIPEDVQQILRIREEGARPVFELNRWRLTFVSDSSKSSRSR